MILTVSFTNCKYCPDGSVLPTINPCVPLAARNTNDIEIRRSSAGLLLFRAVKNLEGNRGVLVYFSFRNF
jgi:hypothetical protein